MQAHELRVVAEHNEVRERANKLATFTESEAYHKLDMLDRALLTAQLRAMHTYIGVLTQRISRFQA
jgi:hypothetical protein